jgi:hypothetical protein
MTTSLRFIRIKLPLIESSFDCGRSEKLIGRYIGHRRDDLDGNIAIAERGPLPEDLYDEARKRLQPADG